jgi:hypothetical protein
MRRRRARRSGRGGWRCGHSDEAARAQLHRRICGGALRELEERRVVARTNDCSSFVLGSRAAFCQLGAHGRRYPLHSRQCAACLNSWRRAVVADANADPRRRRAAWRCHQSSAALERARSFSRRRGWPRRPGAGGPARRQQ